MTSLTPYFDAYELERSNKKLISVGSVWIADVGTGKFCSEAPFRITDSSDLQEILYMYEDTGYLFRCTINDLEHPLVRRLS